MKDVKDDETMIEKTKRVLSMLESFKDRDLDAKMLKQILKIQDLVRETGV
jgi:hypothetical protein